MASLRFIFGDQLSHTISSLEGCDREKDIILMAEVMEEAIYVKHHKKKIAFLFSAMRHYAKELENKGYNVDYITLEDKRNEGSFTNQLEQALDEHAISNIVITTPSEYRVLEMVKQWEKQTKLPVEIRPDTRFLCPTEQLNDWASGRKQLRMEHFYQLMRKTHNILLEEGKPIGGKWNYDSQNRKRFDTDTLPPPPLQIKPDTITNNVIELVDKRFDGHFGELEPFHLAVTRKDALQALDDFIKHRLPLFGDYQDAMVDNEAFLYHAYLSAYLNCGLLLPLECIQAAEAAYHQKKAPLNAVEGFIRQILGWREYVRGIYWLNMPDYKTKNFFNATRPLPDFYWTGDTKMHCLKQAITQTKENAYAHHIQRLMVLGNFTLLAGIHPDEVNEWYMIVYADAYEWVELPNVTGMALFADGGILASKPYASSGSYIHKMSDYCNHCQYKVKEKTGPDACPFNYLYWDFLKRNRKALEHNPRIAMMYHLLDKMSAEDLSRITKDASLFLHGL